MATAEEIKIRITAQDSASQVIRQTSNEMQTLSRTATSTGVTTTKFGGNLSTMGRTAGQAGIQVQQLVGQIQGGTNPMLALSQQAADLGFVLGAPLVGAVVALGASLAMNLIPQLFETAKTAADLSKEIDQLRARTGSLTDAQRALLQQNRAEQIKKEREEVQKLTQEIESNQRAVISLRQAQEDSMLDPEAMGIVDYESQIADLQEKRVTIVGRLSLAESRLRMLEAGRTEEGDKFILSLQDQVAMLGKSRAEVIAYEASKLDLSETQEKLVESLLLEMEVHELAEKQLKRSQTELEKLADTTDLASRSFDNAAATGIKSMEDGLTNLVMGTGTVSDAFRNMANSIISDLIRIQIRKSITAPLAEAISVGGLGDLFGGFFADGGRPPMGKVSVVGENGPELFVPDSAGTIVPNGVVAGGPSQAGGQPVHVTFNIQSWDSRDTLQAIQQSAPQIVGIVQNAFNKRGRRGPMG